MKIENLSEKRKRALAVTDILNKEYGTDCKCYLDHDGAWQLLVATILSAQCTDARVNIITKDLFVKYPAVSDFANAKLSEMEQDVKQAGFYHNKAKNIIECAKQLIERFDGIVPSDMDELTSLPGVGRKTANVIRGNVYGIESIVVDTHVKRITGRFGLTKSDDPETIEYELMEILPKDRWILYNIHIIRLGRSLCKANHENCKECFLNGVCPYGIGRLKA